MITYYENGKMEVAIMEQAKPGKVCCGDAHTVIHTDDYTICAVVDGLGSGEGALQSANAAVEVINTFHGESVQQIVEACNRALLHKRGAVMTIIKVDYSKGEVCYSNFGNIGFVMHLPDGKTIQPIPSRGYLSGKKQKITSHCFPYESGVRFYCIQMVLRIPHRKKC